VRVPRPEGQRERFRTNRETDRRIQNTAVLVQTPSIRPINLLRKAGPAAAGRGGVPGKEGYDVSDMEKVKARQKVKVEARKSLGRVKKKEVLRKELWKN